MLDQCCMVGTVESISTGAKTMASIFETKQVEVDAINPGDALQAIYLDWFNNFLSVPVFAEYYNISESAAVELISVARTIHESRARRAS